jgi:hypothetical protein
MEPSNAQKVGYFATILLALCVGMLIGRDFCHGPEPAQEIAGVPCPEISPVVIARCPAEEDHLPDEHAEAPRPAPPPPTPRTSRGEVLPQTPPAPTPRQRSELLGWARGESTSLQACPRDPGTTYRIAVTLHLRDARIDDVGINADNAELPPALHQCLRDRIRAWTVPDYLVTEHDRLLFSLTL